MRTTSGPLNDKEKGEFDQAKCAPHYRDDSGRLAPRALPHDKVGAHAARTIFVA